jgi:hypothetical protein
MKPRDAVAIVAAGLIVVGEVVPDKHKPYWLDAYHSHVEFPEGMTGNFSRMSADSNTNTNPASAGLFSPISYVPIIGKK